MARPSKNTDDTTKPIKKANETPLAKQYNQIKARYPGALLLFRVGDFYETFGEDAVRASKILGITLTRRNNGTADDHLAGFPHHSLDTYLPRLVRAGERVAICDQLEDPATAKGIVKRGVTELVTPGVSYNDNVLDTKQNNYLAAISFSSFSSEIIGIAFLDISTGEFLCSQGSPAYIEKLLQSFGPSEVLFCKKNRQEFTALFGDKFNTFGIDDWAFTRDFTYPLLTNHFKTNSLKGFGIESLAEGIIAAGVVMHYLAETEHKEVSHISRINRLEEEKYVWLDRFTIRNLELVSAQQEGGISLIQILDQTMTPMGARLLRKWLVLPLKEKSLIQERLETVSFFKENTDLREFIEQQLKPIGDLERLISKVAVRRINPRELATLKRALSRIEPIRELLINSVHSEDKTKSAQTANVTMLRKYADQLNPCQFLLDKIENELRDESLPIVTNQGGMIKAGVDEELDRLLGIAHTGKDFLLQLQNREIDRTGISSLKVSFNKVFGYYLEVTNAHKDKVPNDWIRKQTLVNAERYITPELKEYEETILGAEDKIAVIEFRIFNELVNVANDYVHQIQQNAKIIAVLDVLTNFAKIAEKNNYAKPQVSDSKELVIKDGRHPVIEQQLPLGENYVPNDLFLDDSSQQIIIITGPNMAGKSALLRQTALIVLMAQIGCFVPASEAKIGVVDKVFTRVGASDNLSKGESTFMVEMTETASILNNLSDRSLVLMDEIGRGTSTYDGVSIAWAIAEHLHNHANYRPKTLFATHYHELNELANDFPRIKNFNVSVKEINGKVIFMRKLKEGGSEHSFGIHVAQLAGIPHPVVYRASEILIELEKNRSKEQHRQTIREMPKQNFQMNIFGGEANPKFDKIEKLLKHLDINAMSPIEALLKLNEVKKAIE
ncbi:MULTISPECIES: DNA mismatch repair protein MutS [unclassified Arcicella]|uniref:DNA mismatch repair protein MutS n=1 Tax=unclassified Arcicella TaxID=2644986 RepID=UPI00285C6899|nr:MULTISPECIES: DNA mismatch repair protein MutS [unclassified Arcicella]MDR6562830.1 DNA mismatch repair protein MutS [Arcicella sp. BE51]MDR6812829.1 DNA mismatch repair protein MutS [Arcicella sp. BE140]MDR6824141.1 DNA mismatch repair protein MutS [Arcicella sp. BE139]